MRRTATEYTDKPLYDAVVRHKPQDRSVRPHLRLHDLRKAVRSRRTPTGRPVSSRLRTT
ncbi:hypothetical protein HBB16_08390 [Pseudonocardia sp. MCCB 268]|nr:hypothetical protein [Pseudonocardia cytotoxica]